MIRLIIWIVIGILALSFFGISLRHIVESPTNQDNFTFAFDLVRVGWQVIVEWLKSIPAYFGSIFHG